MKHFLAVLGVAAALLLAGVACGGDDSAPQLGDGPAADVHGAWRGQYMASDGSQTGVFCVQIEQDGRALKGEIRFGDGEPTPIGGVIAGDLLNFVFGAGLQPSASPADPANLVAGGTMNGTVTEHTVSGTWIAASTQSHGDWSGLLLTDETCS